MHALGYGTLNILIPWSIGEDLSRRTSDCISPVALDWNWDRFHFTRPLRKQAAF